ncbi:protein SMG7-like [Olea europaea var. sylvestris]|uniref:protein SMG7-like n=1 Tax=Olea europaea var. sylvestris TaxID=158386 RepID=UPI000C1D53FE|nr:protein SMG7-like [Olea europaea var. sylvestris]XP_022846215.1 protein SMG7-like [Olea europaea var. sylvestris]XP_022846221.1 protein SMG7-like [Olea europaea var. sylvestris]
MDNDKEISAGERVLRLFDKNVELENKRKKAAQARVPSDPNAWQQMRENYEAIILEDHSFSEQHDIEYALWQLHYRRIEELRAHLNAALASSGLAASQNGKGPTRGGPDRASKIRSQFKTFLSEATGFYHDLMLKIRAKYGLPLGYSSDDPENQISMSEDGNKFSEVKKGLISCHRCFIYLGDLARYKGLYGEGDSKARAFAAASSYYLQASSLWPSSGNPHHQLAILASYSNDELVSTYRYFRSLAVDHPFVTARDNLIIVFEKNRQSYTQLLGDAKASSLKTVSSRMPGKGRGKGGTRPSFKDDKVDSSAVKEHIFTVPEVFKAFSIRFVRLNGILFTRTSLETFEEVFSVVKNDLVELLSSGPDEKYNFGSDAAECRLAIVRMVAILIFTVHNVKGENENQSYADILQRSVLLQNSFTAIFEFMACMLERCNQLTDPSSSYLLPGIMVFVEWLACCNDVAVGSEIEDKQVNARSVFWNHCITFFNKLVSNGYLFLNEDKDETCFSNMSKYDESETVNRLALSEDFELRGFIPLLPAQLILDFSRKPSFGSDDSSKEKQIRIQRIFAAGKALSNVVQIGQEGFYFDAKLKKFVIGVEPQIIDDYALMGSFEVPKSNGNTQENSIGSQMALGSMQPVPHVSMEGEDEDEVIVFKPSVTEKQMNNFDSTISEAASGAGKFDFGNENGSFSLGHDSFLWQNAISTGIKPPATIAQSSAHYFRPVLPSTSQWLVEPAPVVNGFSHLNLMENRPAMKPHLQDLGVSQAAALSVPYPQFVNADASRSYPIQTSHIALSSKFDSTISSGAAADSLYVKPSLVMSAGLKKNPVSRPVRHVGPPPGFGSVPSKVVDDSMNSMTLKIGNTPIPKMDDYSWLDGYQLSSSNQSFGFNHSINTSGQMFGSMSKNNSSVGMSSFPFPGKQVSTLQIQGEKQQDHQFSEHMKVYQEQQQQQLKKEDQQSVALPQQYQGQALWDGHFFV